MHNIDMSNNRANIAFLGSRKNIWHRLGQEMLPGMTLEQWQAEAGLNWQAVKVPALADCSALGGSVITVNDRAFVVRNDTFAPLGYVSGEDGGKGYQIVQPRDVLEWFQQYIGVDSRFALDTAMSLKGGSLICATATYNGDIDVNGEKHTARLLMSTTFDGTGSTVNQMTMTRVVCNNTLNIALADKRAVIRTRHNTKFNAEKVGQELATLASTVESYKAMGAAMLEKHMPNIEIAAFFRQCLDIPMTATREDVSTKKMNQYDDLSRAYSATLQEGTAPNTAWAALNAVTRYVDHDRTTRGGNSPDEARFLASQYGSGATLKAKALGLLLPDWSQVAVAA